MRNVFKRALQLCPPHPATTVAGLHPEGRDVLAEQRLWIVWAASQDFDDARGRQHDAAVAGDDEHGALYVRRQPHCPQHARGHTL